MGIERQEFSYEVSIDPINMIIVSRVFGDVDAQSASDMGSKMRIKAKEMNYALIIDWRNSFVNVSIIDAHRWFPKFYDKLDKELRYVRTALLYNESDHELFNFIEDSWRNRGITTRCMTNEDEAIEWLIK